MRVLDADTNKLASSVVVGSRAIPFVAIAKIAVTILAYLTGVLMVVVADLNYMGVPGRT
jgi:hypothetical protein